MVVIYVPMRGLSPRSYVPWFVGLYGMGTLLTHSINNIHRIQQNPSRSCHPNPKLTAEDSTVPRCGLLQSLFSLVPLAGM